MWMMTNFGFFSAVQRTDKVPAGDNRTLQIRARRVQDIDALRELMGDQLGPNIFLKGRDYQVRAYCTPEAWGRALYDMSMGIDYKNFKSSVKDKDLHDAYMDVWTVMYDNLVPWAKEWKASRRYSWSSSYTSTSTTTTRKTTGTGGEFWESGTGRTDWWNDKDSYSGGRSAFGPVENPDATHYSSSTAVAKYDPYDGMPDFSELVDDLADDDVDSEAAIDALLDRYAPQDAPVGTLSLREAKDWLGCTHRHLREFINANKRWRAYRNSSQGRYEFPKAMMGEMQLDYDIWYAEKMEEEGRVFDGETVS